LSLLRSADPHRVREVRGQSRRLRRVVSYPPPSTGTNYNLVPKVEHDPKDKVIWKIMRSLEGHFVYDFRLKSNKRKRRKRCSCCQSFVEPGKKKCLKCQSEKRKARNRRYYQSLKGRIKTVFPWDLSIDF